jgi:hypothetical protein
VESTGTFSQWDKRRIADLLPLTTLEEIVARRMGCETRRKMTRHGALED